MLLCKNIVILNSEALEIKTELPPQLTFPFLTNLISWRNKHTENREEVALKSCKRIYTILIKLQDCL